MSQVYVVTQDPESTNSLVGVFSTAKQLADACTHMESDFLDNCLVKIVLLDKMKISVAGYDFVGTRLSEFLQCPIAQDN